MAASDNQGWVGYGYNRRFNPQTGEVQYDTKGNGNWQTVATMPKYDPQAPAQNYRLNPNQVSTSGNFLVNQAGGGWSLPDENTLRQIYFAQQAAQGRPGQQQQAPSYYGGGQPSWSGGWAGGAGAGGAPATTSGTVGGGAQGGGGNTMAYTAASQFPTAMFGSVAGYSNPANIAEWQKWYGANQGKTIMVGGQPRVIGQDITGDEVFDAFTKNSVGYNVPQQQTQPAPQINQPQTQIGGPGQLQPEQVALQQMQQIDPASEALRQGLGQSYLQQLQSGGQPSNEQLQSYLNQFQQIDPQSYAAMQGMGGQFAGMSAEQQQAVARMSQLAQLGTQLDPETLREITQGTRQGQAARGNVYGTPQLVAEAMTRGQAGMAIQQQREQMLQNALQGQQGGLGAYQSYLTSGATPGGLALQLYQQQQNQIRANQAGSLGYLGSGQTPYQVGASYVDRANAQAAQAAQGGYQYNPSNLGSYYTGAGTSSFPAYGLDTSTNAANWYNNINSANLGAYGYQQAYGNRGGGFNAAGAGMGALGGAASGALAGSAAGGIGAIPGAIIGGLGGAASGGFSR